MKNGIFIKNFIASNFYVKDSIIYANQYQKNAIIAMKKLIKIIF